ncbi:MAG: effector-associated domain EAD1-containing protein [Bryobacteraceae bacterium]
MPLTGSEFRQLRDALVTAFPTPFDLAAMCQFGTGKNLAAIVNTAAALNQQAFELVQKADAQGWLDHLVEAAREENPGNPDLQLIRFAQKRGLMPVSPEDGALQAIVVKAAKFQNPDLWIETMGKRMRTVCRVEMPEGKGIGTGFLVGKSTVMTNDHVRAALADPAQVVLRFDYKTSKDGVTVRKGKTYRLAAGWNLDASPVPQLDYAILRTDGEPGSDSIGNGPNSPPRGWLDPQPYTFEPNEPLLILQHPDARPLELAFNSVQSETNKDRIEHNVSTQPGSSGSPCFNASWELVALHHWGSSSKNRAVRFRSILAEMQNKGTAPLLGT